MVETIELREIGMILKKRLWLIALFVLVACAASGFYGFIVVKPVYQASTKLIVNQSFDNGTMPPQMNQSLISANIMLIETYKEIIRTNAIMDKVAEQYPQFNLTAEQLMRKVQVSSVNETQVMTVAVQDGSYDRAVQIVNAVAAVFKDTIPTIMMIDNVEILSPAKEDRSPAPIGSGPLSYVAMSLIAALIVGVGLSLLLEYLDDSVKNETDVLRVLQTPTYAVISNIKPKDLKPKQRQSNQPNIGEAPYATLNQ